MTNRKKSVLEPTPLAFIDALRDENEAYTRKLMQAGVNVAAARVLAAFHRLRHVECFGRYARSKVAARPASPKLAGSMNR
jgi:acetyl esterase/lipase